MKLQVAGIVVVVGMTLAGVTAGSGGTPNDYVGVANRPSASVYEAFSAMEPEGVRTVTVAGTPVQLTQRVTKVAGERLRLELEHDGDTMVTAELRFAPAVGGQGTEVRAEIDASHGPVVAFMRAVGDSVPAGRTLDHDKVDDYFAEAMTAMVQQAEQGVPLTSPVAMLSGGAAAAPVRPAATPRPTRAPVPRGPGPADGAVPEAGGWGSGGSSAPAGGGWGN